MYPAYNFLIKFYMLSINSLLQIQCFNSKLNHKKVKYGKCNRFPKLSLHFPEAINRVGHGLCKLKPKYSIKKNYIFIFIFKNVLGYGKFTCYKFIYQAKHIKTCFLKYNFPIQIPVSPLPTKLYKRLILIGF